MSVWIGGPCAQVVCSVSEVVFDEIQISSVSNDANLFWRSKLTNCTIAGPSLIIVWTRRI
jgi:hypothetical protein